MRVVSGDGVDNRRSNIGSWWRCGRPSEHDLGRSFLVAGEDRRCFSVSTVE
jgi:hypothetical protein